MICPTEPRPGPLKTLIRMGAGIGCDRRDHRQNLIDGLLVCVAVGVCLRQFSLGGLLDISGFLELLIDRTFALCFARGTEIAHWLLVRANTTGSFQAPAALIAS